MALSGTVPFFDVSTAADPGGSVVVTVTGLEADSQATGSSSTETLGEFYQRACNALSVSGILSGTAQAITPAELSGVMHIQQELALRASDLEQSAAGNPSRLARAQAILAVSGQVQFGV